MESLRIIRSVLSKRYVKEPAFVPKNRDYGAASHPHVRETPAHRARILTAERKIVSSSLPLFSSALQAIKT
jgi:hypothetical protein